MQKTLLALPAACFLVLVVLITYGRSVGLGLNHDEHQFIAPAVLWAREGLVPYRDVPLFHQPYLNFIDAVVGKNATSPLLAARLVSGTAAFLTGLLLFSCAWFAARSFSPPRRLVTAISVVLLWLTSDLFATSSGRSWNHDLPCLLALSSLALLLFVEKILPWHWLLAGFLGGLATGGRLTFAPYAGLLPLTALLWSNVSLKNRFVHLAFAAVGVLFALLPSGWLYLQSPEGYLFGNFEFPRLPLLEADNTRILKTITPWRKLRFFFKEVVLSNLPLAIACLGAFFLRPKKPLWPWIVPTLALVAGAFAPSRYEMQHFYIVAPLAALLIALFLERTTALVPTLTVMFAALAGSALGYKTFTNATQVFHRADWDVTRIHQDGLDLRRKVPQGKILTLGPIVALEGGLSIYPQLATGPFGWKFAHLVSQARRQKLGLLSREDLESVLANDPPAAILTGHENPKLEKPFLQYAKQAGYIPEVLTDDLTLWLPPTSPTP